MKNIFPFILRNIFLQIAPESRGAYGIFKIFWCARASIFRVCEIDENLTTRAKKTPQCAAFFYI